MLRKDSYSAGLCRATNRQDALLRATIHVGPNCASPISGLGLLRDREILGLDLESQPVVCTHIDIRDPHQRKLRNHEASPSRIEHLELRQDQKQRCHIMAEAILAGEQVEELPLVELLAVLASVLAELARLPENFLMRNRPRDTGDRQTQ
jgi:hypothetical protein